MWVSRLVICFMAYSVLGWIWESTYCTIRERTWENRGFLYGPVCPIYGVGVTCMLIVWGKTGAQGTPVAWWQVFFLSMLGSAVLEYVTSWGLEKLFHARWWDYSDMPLNVNGRICLPASILFGLAGLLVAYVLYKPTFELAQSLSTAAAEILALTLTATLSADTAITVSALTRFARIAKEINTSINNHMEQLVADAVARGDAAAAQLEAATTQLQENREVAAAQLQESREAASQVIKDGRETAAQAISEARETLALERERFAENLRETRAAQMGAVVRSAAKRVRRFADDKSSESSQDERVRLRDRLTRR